TYIPLNSFHLAAQIVRKCMPTAVHLFAQAIEHTYPVAAREQRIRDMRSNEPGSSGDENAASDGHGGPPGRPEPGPTSLGEAALELSPRVPACAPAAAAAAAPSPGTGWCGAALHAAGPSAANADARGRDRYPGTAAWGHQWAEA